MAKKVTKKKAGEEEAVEELSPQEELEQRLRNEEAASTMELADKLGGFPSGGFVRIKKHLKKPGEMPRWSYMTKFRSDQIDDIHELLLAKLGSGDYQLEVYGKNGRRDQRFGLIAVTVGDEGGEDDDDFPSRDRFSEMRDRAPEREDIVGGIRKVMEDSETRREDRLVGIVTALTPLLTTMIDKAMTKPEPPPKDDFTQDLLKTLIETQAKQKTDNVSQINEIMGATMTAVQGAYGELIKFAMDKATEVKEADSPSDESIGAILGNMAKEFVKGRQLPEPAAEGQPGVTPSPGRPGSTMPAPGKPAPGAGEALDRTPIRNACIARFHAYLAGSDPSCTEESVCNFWNEHLNVEESDILISMLDDEDDSVESQEKLNGFFAQYPRAGEVVMLITQNTPKVMKLLERFAGDEDEVIDSDQPEEIEPAPMGDSPVGDLPVGDSPVGDQPVVEAEIVKEGSDEKAPGTGGSQSDGDPDQPEPGRDEAAG
jgi:hypothetical protein